VYVKQTDWPFVLPDDHGIRLAGRPDACFYCRAKVGQLHERDCVVVYKHIRFAVFIGEEKVGVYDEYIPHEWSQEKMEFCRNESTWCADNALDTIVWTNGKKPVAVSCADVVEGCTCSLLAFKVEQVLDEGPFVYRPGLNQGASDASDH
jgi:hypothetical protein